ncbi:methyltransferase domain-containing protein [Actinomadura sp. BRA 177]|nr:methyltransferase domain-containing protein [Actinomadura sp. BRA 177]
MLRRAHRRTTALLQTNIYALPFAPTTFDACVTYNGLHCLDDPPAAIAELTRVLTRSSATQAEPPDHPHAAPRHLRHPKHDNHPPNLAAGRRPNRH